MAMKLEHNPATCGCPTIKMYGILCPPVWHWFTLGKVQSVCSLREGTNVLEIEKVEYLVECIEAIGELRSK